jgi:hypothetical protein
MLSESFYLFRKTVKGWIGGRFDWPASSIDERFNACIDGGISPSVSASFVLIQGRVTPSASCILVFDHALRPITSLWSLHLLELDRTRMLLHHNQIHFSPEHALKISVFDLRTRQAQ